MKRILMLVFLLVILPTSLFASNEFKFLQIRFFEAGDDAPEASQRKFTVQFAKNTTRYVWCQVDVENLLYNVREHTHKIEWRYYNSDGTLRGRVDSDFRIKPIWSTAWHQNGWGLDKPGSWPVGTYRVDVWIDGEKVAQDFFTIYDDAAMKTTPVGPNVDEKVYLEFQYVKLFEGGFTAPPESQRQYNTQFPKSTTRYVFFEVGAKNLLYKNRVHKPPVVGRYYNPDGSLRGEAKVNVDILPEWEETDIWSGWGLDQPGSWPVGTYRVEIWFGNMKVGETKFTIY